MVTRASLEKKWKHIDWIIERAIDDVGYWATIFLAASAFSALVGLIFFYGHIGYLISSYIAFLIGLALLYRRHPVGAITGFLAIVFLGVVTLAAFFQTNFDFLTAGITGILVIITGWYAKNMHTQIQIMNNKKFGKVIAEISRYIFTPLENDLKGIKLEFEKNLFIEQILPTVIKNEEGKRGKIKHFLDGKISIFPIASGHREIEISSKRLLNINDEDLPFTIKRLKQLDIDYNRKIDDLKVQLKKFDDDFLPYFQEFKFKCIDLSNSSQIPVAPDENYFKLVLLFTVINLDAAPNNIGSAYEPFANRCDFINAKRGELFQWIQNILILREDVGNIENKKIELIACIDDMVREINILYFVWKRKYYLTESEFH